MRFVLLSPVPQLISVKILCSINDFIRLTTGSPMHFQQARGGGFATGTDDNRLSTIWHQ